MPTPRFLHIDRLNVSSSVLSASGFQPGFPPTNVRDQDPGKGCRTPVGWVINAGNNKLDFTEDGVARVATITIGTYTTGINMALAVEAAMNAAPGAVNTYTVDSTVSPGVHKFLVAKATGAAVAVLKCGGGANFTNSIHPDLGFDDADQALATSGLSDFSTWQSRQAIYLDLGDPLVVGATPQIDAVGVIVGEGYGVVSAKLQGSDATLVGVGYGASPATEIALAAGQAIRAAHFTATRRHWRLLLNGVGSPAAYTEVAVWRMGSYDEPGKKLATGLTRHYEGLSTNEFAKGGSHTHDAQPRRLVLGMSWKRASDADRLIFEALTGLLPVGRNFFLTLDPADVANTTHYGFLRSDPAFTHRPLMDWDVGLEFAEAL